jgi:hypothetical protein
VRPVPEPNCADAAVEAAKDMISAGGCLDRAGERGRRSAPICKRWDLHGASTTLGYSANGAGTGGMLSINDGSNSANIALLCNYIAGSFVAANDGHGGTVITDPATIASNQPQLTQSHA